MTDRPVTHAEKRQFIRKWRGARHHPVDPQYAKKCVAAEYDCSVRTCWRWHKKWKELPAEEPRSQSVPTATQPRPRVAQQVARATPSPPPVEPNAIDSKFKEVCDYMAYAKNRELDVSMRDAMRYFEKKDKLHDHQQVLVPYHTPQFLSRKQDQILGYMTSDNFPIVFVEGPRRVGKSTVSWVAIIESILEGRRTHWDMLAGTGDSASRLLHDMMNDQLTMEQTQAVVKQSTKREAWLVNGGYIKVHDTSIASVKGIDSHGIFIDEFDVVLKNKPEVFAAIVGVLRARKDMKCILCANQGTGVYRALTNQLRALEGSDDRVKFCVLGHDDVDHIPQENDELIQVLMNASMGEEYTQAQLYNIDLGEGEVFSGKALNDSYKTYDAWLNRNRFEFYDIVIGIDPGMGHATGLSVWCAHESTEGFYHLWEQHSSPLHMKDHGNFLEYVVGHISEIYKSFERNPRVRNVTIACESSSAGLGWMQIWRENGFKVEASNFGSEERLNSKAMFAHIFRIHLLNGYIHIKSTHVHNQLSRYDLDAKDEKNKGNVADACLHAVSYLVGGHAWLDKQARRTSDKRRPLKTYLL